MPADDANKSFDVFISYSHKDAELVQDWLVPRLKQAGVTVCIDEESLDIGVPALVNMENAVAVSRRTLIVLTPAWVSSQWTRFESMLIQHKDPAGVLQLTLPLLLEPCEVPGRINILTRADFTDDDIENEFAKLLDAVRGVRKLPDPKPKTQEPSEPQSRNEKVNYSRSNIVISRPTDLALAGQDRELPEVANIKATTSTRKFDVFLSYSHTYTDWVEKLAARLEDEEKFNVWLDKWVLIPGETWQREMANGLYQAKSCAICIGAKTSTGWFQQEIQRALNRQAKEQTFRVIPVLLPDADIVNVDDFLELRTWVDFRNQVNPDYAFYHLTCGVRGVPPGRWPPKESSIAKINTNIEDKLRILRQLKQDQLIDDEISLEYQRKLLERHLGEEG